MFITFNNNNLRSFKGIFSFWPSFAGQQTPFPPLCTTPPILGERVNTGNPTEDQAKKASKAQKIRKLAEERPEMSRAEIAREVGTDRSAVTHALKKKQVTEKHSTQRKPPQPTVKLSLDPTRTAANIRAKMGAPVRSHRLDTANRA